ncbi:MAG: carboxypeptidase-like regulatory domain-containing protein [Planctomycetota bacterium]
MRRCVVLCLLVLVPTAIGEPRHRIRGAVLAPDGAALRGARVTLQGRHGGCLIVPGCTFVGEATDEAGRFDLPTPDRAMDLYVEHPDYAPAWVRADDGAVVRLKEPAFVSGTVSAPAQVRIAHGLRDLAAARSDGTFRLGPLPPGEAVTLLVRSPGHRPYRQRLVLAAGETNVTVVLEEGLAVTGRVTPPLAGVVLRASQGEMRESRAVTGADGSFRITGLRRGPVCVVVLAEGREPLVLCGTAGEPLDVRWER